MKLLAVHNYYQEPGGEDAVFRMECDLLRRNGHTVVEYCRSNAEISHFTTVGKLATIKTAIWASDTQTNFRRLLSRERPDVVHAHNTFPLISPSLFTACRDAGVPVVQTLHNYRLICPRADFFRDGHTCEECKYETVLRGVRYGCYRASRCATASVALMLVFHRWKQTWTEMVDRYIALSQFSRRQFCEAQLPREKVVVKPNFIHPDPGIGTCARMQAVFVGRLSQEKGLQTLLSAWDVGRPSIPLHIVGDGPFRDDLHAFVHGRNIPGIRFHGRVERPTVMAMLQAARFLVVPSECYENCPTTILEAFACGCPVIASDIGAVGEMVANGVTGLRFKPRDVADLATKIRWAIMHPDEMERMGLSARAEYEQKYTARKNYKMLMEIYSTVSAGARTFVADNGIDF